MRTPDQRFDECKRVVAKLLQDGNNFVTVRYVMEEAALSQGQVSRLLKELTRMGWLHKRRAVGHGQGYYPTNLGKLGFSCSLPVSDG